MRKRSVIMLLSEGRDGEVSDKEAVSLYPKKREIILRFSDHRSIFFLNKVKMETISEDFGVNKSACILRSRELLCIM